VKPLEEAIRRIAVDTIIHEYLMEGVVRSLEEAEKVGESLETFKAEEAEIEKLPPETRSIVKRFIEMHLEIEKNMIETYEELAEKAEHPVIKALAKAIAENEKQHHAQLMELHNKI
jgi:rubrerythrin